jgi:murein L,D-transpeptidase YcbB/YkuD
MRTAVVLLLTLLLAGCSKSPKPADPAAPEIRQLLGSGRGVIHLTHVPDSILSSELLQEFYKHREFVPVWSNESGLSAAVDSIVAVLRTADGDGLDPQDYHVESIDSLTYRIASHLSDSEDALRADADLLLSEAFMLYACHMSEGKIERDSLRPRQALGSERQQYAELLAAFASSQNPGQMLRELAPAHAPYIALRELLTFYRAKAADGTQSRIPAGSAIKPGETGKPVFALRTCLLALGDLHPRSGSTHDLYDSTLVDAVRVFQKRHGYEATGVADSATISALNVTPQKRVEQIKATMERWRWMPHSLGRKHIVINIPDFRLSVVEQGRVLLTMKVVLGLSNWQTPVFSSAMEQVLFNSHWMAPEDIVEKELINYMKADSNYLPSNNMSLWRKSGDSLVKIDPRTINWPEMTPEKIDFFLRQEGGPQNIMGQVKFLIPNKYNVYLHDTPYRDDFAKNIRMFSHGCIRLDRPFDLAEYVLRQFPEWDRARIDTAVARRTEHLLRLKLTIPVHIIYCTVWKATDGSVQFRDDYYGLDRRLSEAMRRTSH